MRRRALLATMATVATAGCLGLGRSDRRTCGDDCDIGMSAAAFEPREYTASIGETVTWKNTSSTAHTVTAYDGELPNGAAYFASGGFDTEPAAVQGWFDDLGGRLSTGDRFRYTVEVPGRYEYYCIPHEPAGMLGTLIVMDE